MKIKHLHARRFSIRKSAFSILLLVCSFNLFSQTKFDAFSHNGDYVRYNNGGTIPFDITGSDQGGAIELGFGSEFTYGRKKTNPFLFKKAKEFSLESSIGYYYNEYSWIGDEEGLEEGKIHNVFLSFATMWHHPLFGNVIDLRFGSGLQASYYNFSYTNDLGSDAGQMVLPNLFITTGLVFKITDSISLDASVKAYQPILGGFYSSLGIKYEI